MSSLGGMKRGLSVAPARSGALSLQKGDVVATMTAISQEGLNAALAHLMNQFPNGFTFDFTWTGNVALPVDEQGKPLPPDEEKALRENLLERQKAAGKILRPAPQPGVVNQDDLGIRVAQFPSFTIVAIAAGDTIPRGRELPEPDPRNSPNGDPYKH